MKKLVYSIVSIISLLCLASCAQDEKLILDPDNFVASSSENADALPVQTPIWKASL